MATGSVRPAIAEVSISGAFVSRRRGFWGSGGPIAIKPFLGVTGRQRVLARGARAPAARLTRRSAVRTKLGGRRLRELSVHRGADVHGRGLLVHPQKV